MKIRRLHLLHWCQHLNREVHFTGNLVGLIGPNGAGKSNLTGAIADLITGDFSAKKSELMTLGEKTGSGEVEVELQPGVHVTIRRLLHKNEAALIFSDGRPEITGIEPVNAAIYDLIRQDNGLLRNIVFVGQEDIKTLLFARPAEKARLVQRFFGVERAARIEKALSDRINAIQLDQREHDLPRVQERIAVLTAERDEIHAALRNRLAQETELPHTSDDLRVEEARLQAQIGSERDLAQRLTTHANLLEIVTTQETQISQISNQLAAEQAQLASVPIDQVRQRIEEAKRARDIKAQHDLANNSLINVRSSRARVQAPTIDEAALAAKEAEIERLRASVTELMNERSTLLQTQLDEAPNTMLETIVQKVQIEGYAECPVCTHVVMPEELPQIADRVGGMRIKNLLLGQPAAPEPPKRTTQQIESEITTAQNSIRFLGNEITVARSSVEQYRRAIAQLDAQEAMLLDQQAKLPALPANIPDTTNLEQAVQIYDQTARSIETKRVQVQTLQGSLAAQRQRMEAMSTGIYDPATNRYLVTSPTETAQKELRLQRVTDLLRFVELHESEIRRVNGVMVEVEAQRQVCIAARDSNMALQRYRSELLAVREVFHYNGAPKVLVDSRLALIESHVNQYLDIFGADFDVIVDDGLNFKVRFPQYEKVMDADRLSGGQKITLALAFRFAACETFGSNIGLMVLDEPTVWLDDDRMEAFSEIFARLAILGREWNMQFIIVTHEKRLIPFFDQVIDLTPQ